MRLSAFTTGAWSSLAKPSCRRCSPLMRGGGLRGENQWRHRLCELGRQRSANKSDYGQVKQRYTERASHTRRINSALINSGFGYPYNKGITINLAPANVRKEGAGFDLPMALGILGAMGAAPAIDQYLMVGELSLDGSIRPVRGALSVAVCARNQ